MLKNAKEETVGAERNSDYFFALSNANRRKIYKRGDMDRPLETLRHSHIRSTFFRLVVFVFDYISVFSSLFRSLGLAIVLFSSHQYFVVSFSINATSFKNNFGFFRCTHEILHFLNMMLFQQWPLHFLCCCC